MLDDMTFEEIAEFERDIEDRIKRAKRAQAERIRRAGRKRRR